MLLNMPSLLQFLAVFSMIAFHTQANPIHYSSYEKPNFYDLFHVEPQVAKLPAADGNLNIFALPVGQGDCTVIQCPNGDITIIDLGSRKSTGFDSQDLINYLNGQNVEAIFLTHSDLDHVNLLMPFLNSLKAQNKSYPPVYHSCPWTRYGVNIAGLKTTEIKSCCPCKTINICGNAAALEIKASGYNNCPDPNDESPNGDSIVMRLKYKANSVFLPGDFEGGVKFINNFLACAGNIKSDVLRLSHHGADNGKANTDSFLNAIDPISVFSSSGLPSSYGHPRCSLYNRFHAAGIQELFQHDYTCYNGYSYETFTTKDIIYTTTIENFKTKTYENYVIEYNLPTNANQKMTIDNTKV